MRLLIVNLHFEIGGVETLLARIIPLLNKSGIDITLLLLQKKTNHELLSAVTPYCRVIFLQEAFPFSKGKIRKLLGQDFDVAFYTISRALLIGSWLLCQGGYRETKACLGAYQTEIFCPKTSLFGFHHKKLREIIKTQVPASSIIFGNSAGRDFHSQELGIDLHDSHVIRLFVDTEKYTFIDRSSIKRKKIVSIGRITSFKTYNFTLIPVIKNLLDDYSDLEWHIHGDGEQLDELRDAVKENSLSGNIFIHGKMSYSEFENALKDAFLFIGSGTSLIEASACGVPSLTTVEYSKAAISYGFISEIDGDNLIEPNANRPAQDIENYIRKTKKMSAKDYSELQIECREKSKSYSGEKIIQEYISALDHSKINGNPIKTSTATLVASIIGFFLSKLFENPKQV